MPEVEFSAGAATLSGYLALPDDEDGRGHGVLVLPDRRGIDDHVRSICDRLAAEGFVALAADLSDDAALRGAIEHLLGHEAVRGEFVGTLGFSAGGGRSLWAATKDARVGAAVAYYSLLPSDTPDFSQIQCPVLGHVGTLDASIPVEAAAQLATELEEAGVPVSFEYYDGAGHAFFDDTNRLGTYHPEAAERSWGRTVAFIRESL